MCIMDSMKHRSPQSFEEKAIEASIRYAHILATRAKAHTHTFELVDQTKHIDTLECSECGEVRTVCTSE